MSAVEHDDDLPVAEVLLVFTGRGFGGSVRLVTVRCPHCGCRHVHGWPKDTLDVGSRVAHCSRRPGAPAVGPYNVVGGPVARVQPPKRPSR